MRPAIAILRIFWGLVFFSNGLAKVVPGIGRLPGGFYLIDSNTARVLIIRYVQHHPVTLYHDLVFNVLVPNWNVVGPLVGVSEMVAGASLILGLFAPLGALLAALLALHIWFASFFTGPWLFDEPIEWVTLLCLVFMRPGEYLGLDALVRRRGRLKPAPA